MIRYALPIWAFCVLLSCSPTPSERGEGPKAELPVPFEIQSGIWERQPGWAEPQGEEASEPGLRQTAEPARLVIETPEQASKRIAEHVQKQGPSGRGWGRLAHEAPEKTDEPLGSVSLGGSSTGILKKGVGLPLRSEFHEVFGRVVKRDYVYGTEELIEAIVTAAEDVGQRFPGGVLQVGNLSREGGGDIPQSVSHNSGRDADFAFYALDTRGRPVRPDWYISYGPDGSDDEGKGFRLDVPRNWALVESLLLNTRIQVQYIFVAHWIREMLLEYGVRSGASPGVVQRAEVVMRQPGDSSPHAEHFHLRLFCDLNDRLFGCTDAGQRHSWIESWDSAVEDKIARLIAASNLGGEGEANAVAEQLQILRRTPEAEDEDVYSAEEL